MRDTVQQPVQALIQDTVEFVKQCFPNKEVPQLGGGRLFEVLPRVRTPLPVMFFCMWATLTFTDRLTADSTRLRILRERSACTGGGVCTGAVDQVVSHLAEKGAEVQPVLKRLGMQRASQQLLILTETAVLVLAVINTRDQPRELSPDGIHQDLRDAFARLREAMFSTRSFLSSDLAPLFSPSPHLPEWPLVDFHNVVTTETFKDTKDIVREFHGMCSCIEAYIAGHGCVRCALWLTLHPTSPCPPHPGCLHIPWRPRSRNSHTVCTPRSARLLRLRSRRFCGAEPGVMSHHENRRPTESRGCQRESGHVSHHHHPHLPRLRSQAFAI